MRQRFLIVLIAVVQLWEAFSAQGLPNETRPRTNCFDVLGKTVMRRGRTAVSARFWHQFYLYVGKFGQVHIVRADCPERRLEWRNMH
jgi:hypothetical protein